MAVTKQDILKDLEVVKKGLQEVEFYIRNYTEENSKNNEKGINRVIDYMGQILKEIINKQAINYSKILEDAKNLGHEREFRIAYRILRQLNFIDYDQQNKLVTIGSKTRYLIKLSSDSKFQKKQELKDTKEIDQKKIEEIYRWVLDQIDKHGWVEIKVINKEFDGSQKEVMEAIDKIIADGKGKLVDGKQLYKVNNTNTEKPKATDPSRAKKIKELKDQIDTLERRIEIGQAMELSKEELQKLVEEKKKLEDELKQLENQ